MKNLLAVAILFYAAFYASAAITLPPELVGIWAKTDSEFKGEALMKGSAIYIDSDGIGGAIGGDGKDVLGARLVVTAYDTETHIVNFALTENGKVMISGAFSYDPIKKILVSSKNTKEIYERRFDSVSGNIRQSLGLEAKAK